MVVSSTDTPSRSQLLVVIHPSFTLDQLLRCHLDLNALDLLPRGGRLLPGDGQPIWPAEVVVEVVVVVVLEVRSVLLLLLLLLIWEDVINQVAILRRP
jgi:hypothetical protein